MHVEHKIEEVLLVVLATAKCFKIKGGKHWHSSVGVNEVCILNSVSTTAVSL